LLIKRIFQSRSLGRKKPGLSSLGEYYPLLALGRVKKTNKKERSSMERGKSVGKLLVDVKGIII